MTTWEGMMGAAPRPFQLSIPRSGHSFSPRPRIAIVGGGFSGTLVLANLVASAPINSIEIELFERSGDLGPGQAYQTRDPVHLLNVRAERMGAFEHAPDDFLRWLRSVRGVKAWREIWPEREVGTTEFVPRGLYGEYLKDVFASTLRSARSRGIDVRITAANVKDIAPRKSGASFDIIAENYRSRCDAVVLATGNRPPRNHAFLTPAVCQSPRYIADLWQPDAKQRMANLSSRAIALILGTGLTAIDAILTLRAQRFFGRIIAVSPNGCFPRPHLASGAAEHWSFAIPLESVPKNALALFRWLRREVRLAETVGVGWRSVIDSVRPHAQALWRGLNAKERRKLLRRAWLWNIHVHRMPPEVEPRIDALLITQALEAWAADILSIEPRRGGFAVQLRPRNAGARETLNPDLIINCTGPERDIASGDDPLLTNLACRRLITASSACGIATRDGCTADGENDGRILAIGSLLAGELFEATAVAELRHLAEWTASRVLEGIGTSNVIRVSG